ncbi:MAG: SAM-dependent methyltransferase [Halomonas sp.]|nr:SAM-dependent methyltransferase [Halomonas sp.]
MPKHPAWNTEQRFSRLTALLAEWQPWWQPTPFTYRLPPWPAGFSARIEALLELNDEQVARLQANPWQQSPLCGWLPVDELAALVRLTPLDAAPLSLPDAWGSHVSGRKWQQIETFLQHLRVAPHDLLLDWCAGKGHLARALAHCHAAEVSALEWQAPLCEEARRLAARQQVSVRVQEQDVLAPDASRFLSSRTHAVALHACGDLHLRLLELAAASGSAVSLAPCCYHRTRDERYRPVSKRGRELCQRHGLRLDRHDLALAVQETVTAPLGVRRRREQANAWRLGFDELQRELRGEDSYLPVPSLAYGRLPGRFDAFCRWAAHGKGLELPGSLDLATYERAGWKRQAKVKRLELVRHLFRRPLEVWLALDRISLMEEAGFTVEFGTFCNAELTPRNLFIHARKA